MAGAIDVMVVEQPDGSLRCSPFYGEEKRRREGAAA
jgi:phosphatidate phosphatase PAH1